MRTKLTKLITWTTIPVLGVLVVAFLVWGIKTGALNAWADKLKAEIQNILIGQTTSGILITTKDSSGNPVTGALIRAYNFIQEPNTQGRWQEASYLNGITDTNGEYRISGSSPICTQVTYITKFQFTAEKANYTSTPAMSQEVAKTTFCSQLTAIAFTLSLGTPPPVPGKATIKGRVYDKSNNSNIEGAIVSIADAGGFVLGKTTSDKNGNYNLPNITAGIDNTLKSAKSGYDTYSSRLNLSSGIAYPINIGMIPYQPPPAQPDTTKFIYMAEIDDSQTGQLIKDVKAKITISPAISGKTGVSGLVSKDTLVDLAKYGDANLVATNVPADHPPDCSNNNKYTVKFSHSEYQDEQAEFYCKHLTLDRNLNSYVYRAGEISLTRKQIKIYGKVMDETGRELSGAGVTLLPEDDWFQENAVTNPDGWYKIDTSFLITGIGEKEIEIVAFAPGDKYEAQEQRLRLERRSIRKDFQLSLALETLIQGKVTDENNQPINRALVFSGIYATYTNEKGEYSLKITTGSHRITVFHSGYKTGLKRVTVPREGLRNLNFTLHKPKRLEQFVMVKDAITKKEIPGAKVLVKELGKTCITDKFGRCDMFFPPPPPAFEFNAYVFKVEAAGYKTLEKTVLIYYEIPMDIVFELFLLDCENKGILSGHVLDGTIFGYLLEGVNVVIEKKKPKKIITAFSLRDEFEFSQVLEVGEYRVRASKEGYRRAIEEIKILACQETKVFLFLFPTTAIKKCKNIKGAKFCFIGEEAIRASKDSAYQKDWRDIASKILEKRSETKISLPKQVIITSLADAEDDFAGAANEDIILSLPLIKSLRVLLTHMVTHEFGHIYDYSKGWISEKKPFSEYFDKANPCVFENISDGTFDNKLLAGHPESGPTELFASAFHAVNDHRDELKTRIQNAPDSEPDSCKTILENIYNYMVKTVGLSFNPLYNYLKFVNLRLK